MGCHSSKAPASATPVVPEAEETSSAEEISSRRKLAIPSDFNPANTLLTAGGSAEVKKTQSMRQFMRDSMVSTGSSDLDEPWVKDCMTSDAQQAQPVEAENSVNCSTKPAAQDNASFDVVDLDWYSQLWKCKMQNDLASPGVQTMNDVGCPPYESAEPSDKKLEIQEQDAQKAEEPKKEAAGEEPKKEAVGEEPDIPTGSFAPGVAASKAAEDESEKANDRHLLLGNTRESDWGTPEPITTINRVEGASTSPEPITTINRVVANSTSTRKERGHCCC